MSTMRPSFDRALIELCNKAEAMFNDVYEAFERTFDAIENNDHNLAQTVIDDDVNINKSEADINERAIRLFLKECPVASDLRLIIITIKIAYELERIGDYAKNIATYIMQNPKDTAMIRQSMLDYKPNVLSMLSSIKEAYLKRDATMAKAVSKKDDFIDQTFKSQSHQFINLSKEETDLPTQAIYFALIAIKQFERCGDHITNIAEHIYFLNRATFVDFNT